MKRLFLAVLTLITVASASAQKGIANLDFIDAKLGCQIDNDVPENQMTVVFNIDIMPGGGCWVEWYHLGNWHILENSIIFTNPSLHPSLGNGDSAHYSFTLDNFVDSLTQTGLYNEDSMYRFRYVDIVTEQYFTIDTFYTYCAHSFGGLPQFSVVDYFVDCHQGMIQMFIKDSVEVTNGYFYLMADSAGTWIPVIGSQWPTVDESDTIEVLFNGIGQYMHDYDSMVVKYFHTPTFDTYPILYFGVHCPNVGIEDYQQNLPIIRQEWYNLSGQVVQDPHGGVFILLTTYSNYSQSRKKVMIN